MKRSMAWVLALVLAGLMLAAGLAEGGATELSGYFGKDIAQAAGEIGGLNHSSTDEFRDNYDNDQLALRGNGGKVGFIELKAASQGWSVCGVSVGMARADVQALMDGCPMLWEYDEELAYVVRTDSADATNNETLVVFFDEKGTVNGVWYRTSGA